MYIYIEVALRAEDVCITWLRLVAYRADATGPSVQVLRMPMHKYYYLINLHDVVKKEKQKKKNIL